MEVLEAMRSTRPGTASATWRRPLRSRRAHCSGSSLGTSAPPPSKFCSSCVASARSTSSAKEGPRTSPGWPPNLATSTKLTWPRTSVRRFAEAPQPWPPATRAVDRRCLVRPAARARQGRSAGTRPRRQSSHPLPRFQQSRWPLPADEFRAHRHERDPRNRGRRRRYGAPSFPRIAGRSADPTRCSWPDECGTDTGCPDRAPEVEL
jgi:hypothetical protein